MEISTIQVSLETSKLCLTADHYYETIKNKKQNIFSLRHIINWGPLNERLTGTQQIIKEILRRRNNDSEIVFEGCKTDNVCVLGLRQTNWRPQERVLIKIKIKGFWDISSFLVCPSFLFHSIFVAFMCIGLPPFPLFFVNSYRQFVFIQRKKGKTQTNKKLFCFFLAKETRWNVYGGMFTHVKLFFSYANVC